MEPASSILERKSQIFSQIAELFPCSLGKELSKSEREEKKTMNMKQFTYGEVEFMTMAETFASIESEYGGMPAPGTGKFVDLGSGTGKGCLSAALLHPFAQVLGVELLEKLYQSSVDLKNKYDEMMPKIVEDNPELYQGTVPMVMEHNDMFQSNFYDSDIIFANSTCFTVEMMEALGQLPVKPGCILITITKTFGGNWEVLEQTTKMMSWAPATVFISRKTS